MKITVELPDELARDAQEFGLLEEDVVAELLQKEVDRRVMELVNAEIRSYREEQSGRTRTSPIASE